MRSVVNSLLNKYLWNKDNVNTVSFSLSYTLSVSLSVSLLSLLSLSLSVSLSLSLSFKFNNENSYVMMIIFFPIYVSGNLFLLYRELRSILKICRQLSRTKLVLRKYSPKRMLEHRRSTIRRPDVMDSVCI